ncbi:hypothetical protein I7I51_03409 [Histoplasma capsulatum]|uniref:Uncharacterized protein n=1 Tax=Ajellomyces capsulatus TaxID=5037 RepID=A0A8A1MAN6_AJECA|nr:predicted protein [Histoplasma mississippiense (nom. inval.)]EDN07324.1 predicted protein [Histoplasma mississippiense (nom. inval.)]QSS61237.1 hypothetical protein I7I51_03409 [Histoplasma capsulatum]
MKSKISVQNPWDEYPPPSDINGPASRPVHTTTVHIIEPHQNPEIKPPTPQQAMPMTMRREAPTPFDLLWLFGRNFLEMFEGQSGSLREREAASAGTRHSARHEVFRKGRQCVGHRHV